MVQAIWRVVEDELGEWIRKHIRCCSCGRTLRKSGSMYFICLDKLSTWLTPIWINDRLKRKYPEPRALAVVCDKCLSGEVKYAVEWGEGEVKYHPVGELEDLPEIPKDDVYFIFAVMEAGK
jgi:hypothetical protein